MPAVFDPFTCADPSRTRSGLAEGGSGLGPAVAAAITGAHQGRIDVHSDPGRTGFTLSLPASLAAARRVVRCERGAAPG
ncbi:MULTISPECIES: ATP-binding protein [Streptomyces]|uniref:ATP-binding protein n=1 Tax=Streptomyces TaxID=1883 RepID=UPI0004CD5A35